MADKTDPIQGIKPGDYKSARTRFKALKNAGADNRKAIKKLLDKAADEQHLHKPTFLLIQKLREMDPAERTEWLFHFDVQCGIEGFNRDDDLLGDRGPQAKADAIERGRKGAGGGKKSGADVVDLRPRNLRTGASDADQELPGDGDDDPPPSEPEGPSKPH